MVEAFLERQQVELPDTYATLPFDHASVLFYLSATLRELDEAQVAEFEKATLGSWVHEFGKALQKSHVSLYRALGRLLEIL